MAIGQGKPGNVIHHSDQGTLYISLAFSGRGVGSLFGEFLFPRAREGAVLGSRRAVCGGHVRPESCGQAIVTRARGRQPDRSFFRCACRADPVFASASSIQTGA